MITQHQFNPDVIEVCQFETDPFTAAELDAMRRYEERTAGVEDCIELGALSYVPEGASRDDVTAMFRAHFEMLNDWRDALSTLLEDLRQDHPLSKAAQRYTEFEVAHWKVAQEDHRVIVIEYFLGRDKYESLYTYADTFYGAEYADGNFSFVQPI